MLFVSAFSFQVRVHPHVDMFFNENKLSQKLARNSGNLPGPPFYNYYSNRCIGHIHIYSLCIVIYSSTYLL